MFKTQLVPTMKNGMFAGYKKGTREDCTRAQIESLEYEYKQHEQRMQEIKKEIEDLRGELRNGEN